MDLTNINFPYFIKQILPRESFLPILPRFIYHHHHPAITGPEFASLLLILPSSLLLLDSTSSFLSPTCPARIS